jgi:hypothetical protein
MPDAPNNETTPTKTNKCTQNFQTHIHGQQALITTTTKKTNSTPEASKVQEMTSSTNDAPKHAKYNESDARCTQRAKT